MFGILNIYKPKGFTSFDVIAYLRKKLNIKQIGHTGTLDPLAEGVLCICVGKATRLVEFFPSDKTYIATAKLGITTNTYDTEGEVISKKIPNIKIEQIEQILKNFKGKIIQKPPIFSAIKIKGKKLYEYARKNEDVEIPSRTVEIYDLKILNYNNNELTFEIECSSGTYIRSIVHDMGEMLECGACMSKLVRTKANNLSIDASQNLNTFDLKTANFINPLDILELPQIEICQNEVDKISNGQFIKTDLKNNNELALVFHGKLKSIAYVLNGQIKPKKVF